MKFNSSASFMNFSYRLNTNVERKLFHTSVRHEFRNPKK